MAGTNTNNYRIGLLKQTDKNSYNCALNLVGFSIHTLAGVVAGFTLLPVVMLTLLCIGLVVCVMMIFARKRHHCKDIGNVQGRRERLVYVHRLIQHY